MERWTGRVALVTGGSKGIGAAIAEELVKQGVIVYACARNIDPIEKASQQLQKHPGKLIAVKCDLQKDEEILAMFDKIDAEYKGVDILINNCGIYMQGGILSANLSDLCAMQDINIIALCICCREAVKRMQERKVDDGHIINVNSTSGHRVSTPEGFHFYSATKFSVTALTEGLRSELRQAKSHIKVTSLTPGVTDTPGVEEFWADKKDAVFEKLGNIVLKPKDVADSVVFALSSPPHVQVSELTVRPLWHA